MHNFMGVGRRPETLESEKKDFNTVAVQEALTSCFVDSSCSLSAMGITQKPRGDCTQGLCVTVEEPQT